MRKGFTVTLLTVAVAMMGSNAMSMAPVISNIKDIVVANDAPVSGGNIFVYPDAIDLNSVVFDQDTSDSGIIWSYSNQGGDHYLINGVGPLTGAETGLLPPANKRISGPLATTDDPDAVDANKFTITVRNKTLTPIPTAPGAGPAGSGIIASQTDVVIFFASDGDQTDSDTLIIYTDDDGTDRLSPAGGDRVYGQDFTIGAHGWVSVVSPSTGGGSSSATQNGSGLCLTVSAAGNNVAQWVGPYGDVDLAANSVYEIRMTMNTTQTAVDAIPFWNFSVFNGDVVGSGFGATSYGGNYYFLDNFPDISTPQTTAQGGSQGIGRFGRNTFVVYWTPLSVELARWNSTVDGAFQTASDPFNDMQLSFRVFDIGTESYGANADSGTICLQQLDIFRHDLGAFNVASTPYSDTSLVDADVAQSGNGTTYTFTGGVMTATPNPVATGWTSGQLDIVPGTGTDFTNGGPQPLESWPLAWNSDVLYKMNLSVSLPTAQAATDGIPDLITLQLEGLTQTYQQTYMLPNVRYNNVGTGGAGTPPVGTPGNYVAFGYTNEASKSSFFAGLRPHVNMLNIAGILPDPAKGTMNFHGITVQQGSF